MSWSPFDNRRTPILSDGVNAVYGLLQLRPVYYALVDTLLGGVATFAEGDGIILGVAPNYMTGGAATTASGFYYGWNFLENDDPLLVGGFYSGPAGNKGYGNPMTFTSYDQVRTLMIAGTDPNNEQYIFYQILKGGV
jgi:hypothetical protein